MPLLLLPSLAFVVAYHYSPDWSALYGNFSRNWELKRAHVTFCSLGFGPNTETHQERFAEFLPTPGGNVTGSLFVVELRNARRASLRDSLEGGGVQPRPFVNQSVIVPVAHDHFWEGEGDNDTRP